MIASILDVKGIGETTRQLLAEHGITTVEALAAMDVDALIAVPGFSGVRAARVIEDAKTLLTSMGEEAAAGAEEKTFEEAETKKAKKKKSKKKKEATEAAKKKKKKSEKSKKEKKKKKKAKKAKSEESR